MAADLIDFDATLAEAEGEPASFAFKFLGQEWQLPRSPLAKDMLKVRRMYMRVAELQVKQAAGLITEADANNVIELAGGAELDDLLAMLVGQETVDAWFGASMTDEQLRRVFRYLWKLYNGQDPNEPEDEEQGEALPPASRGQRRAKITSRASLKTGTSSRRTGAGSTTKTSRKR